MKTIFKLAWRNIWRNKRRTLITAASIIVAVFLSSLMESIQRGTWDNIINGVVNSYFGYAQIHQNGYWEGQTLDKAFNLNDKLQNLGGEVKQVKGVIPRLESFALASYGINSQGALIIGIDPEAENDMTKLQEKISHGEYLTAEDNAIIIGEGLAQNMKVGLGDTLVLLSQGYRGINAAGKYPIKGMVKFGSPDLNKQMVYMPLKLAQYFFGAEDLVTTLALKINEEKEVNPAIKAIKSKISTDDYEILDYKEMLPELVETRELKLGGNKVTMAILYMLIGFGIFGTIIMMTKEREYEFGVLNAIGMTRAKLAAVVWLETFLLGLVGSILGVLFSLPIIYSFYKNPIQLTGDMAASFEGFGIEPLLTSVFDWQIFFTQAFIIFIITSILALYPILKIRKMKAIEAMRG